MKRIAEPPSSPALGPAPGPVPVPVPGPESGRSTDLEPASTRLSIRLDLDGGRRLGPGKVRLLEALGREGSIAAAGRTFGMSYRRAWLLVDELNRMFAEPLVETRGGGRNGGGATLSRTGETVVALYRALEAKTREAAHAELAALEAALAPPPAAPLRRNPAPPSS